MRKTCVLARFALALVVLAPLTALAQATDTPQAAVWWPYDYTFQSMTFTSTYSCDGLADKLRVLLTAAGAKDVKAYPSGCAAPYGQPDRLARASVKFFSLAPLGAKPPSPPSRKSAVATNRAAPAEPVAAIWRQVTLQPRTPYPLELGDCELIEQFRDHLLPMFTTRNVEQRITCVPHQLSGSSYFLKFEVLQAVPPAAATNAAR
jgi:hypothetical protein